MRILEFSVPADWDGVQAKRFLRGYCKLSYRLMVGLKRQPEGLTMDGALLRTIDRVKYGSTVKIKIPSDASSVENVALPLDIVYEDGDLLLVNKPYAMPVHPSPGHGNDTLANAVGAYLEEKKEKCAFRALNRLDKDTSGLVLLAKNSYIASRLTRQADKRYFALVEGRLEGSGRIDAPLRVKEGYGIRREIGEGGESAVTNWYAVAQGKKYTLLCIRLGTGRTHQIRAHFSCMGHPLAGDSMYEGDCSLLARQALHCGWMQWEQPLTGKTEAFFAPLPEDIMQAIAADSIYFENTRASIFSWAEKTKEAVNNI